jgi:hypothetical protein
MIKRLFKSPLLITKHHKKHIRHRILDEAETSGSHVAHHYAPILIPCFHPTFSVLKTELFEHSQLKSSSKSHFTLIPVLCKGWVAE